MLAHYQVVAKQIKNLPPELKLSGVCIPSEVQKCGELLILTMGIGLAKYGIYKYLK